MVLFVRGKEWLQCKYGKSVQPEERAGPTVFSLRGSSSTWSFHPQLPRVYVCVHPSCVTLESGTFSPDMLTLGQVDGGEGSDEVFVQTRALCTQAQMLRAPFGWYTPEIYSHSVHLSQYC